MAANKKISMTGIILKSIFRALIYISIILLFYMGLTQAYAFGYSIFDNSTMSKAPGIEMDVEINKGASDSEVAAMLEKRGLISDSKIFMIQSKFYSYTIYPGTYTLNTSMTVREILIEISQQPEIIEETEESTTSATTESEDITEEEPTP